MIRNEVPTFRRWGKNLLEWKRAIIIALLVLGAHYAGTHYLKRYYAVIESCDQPCQDGINCEPLEFTFEVKPAKLKLGEPHYLWYRARIKNRSCRRIASISVAEFLDSEKLRDNTMFLGVAVIGPDGRKLERLPAPGPDGGIAWDYAGSKGASISTGGIIHPYQPDYEKILRLYKTGKLSEQTFVDLEPGESFETITPVLRPYRIVATSVRTEDGGLAHGHGRVPAENPPAFPTPPEGYIHLDRYKFDRPGRHTILARFSQEITLHPIYTRWNNRMRWTDLFFWPTYPASLDTLDYQRREVNLAAPPVTIEVVR